ncbi:shadow of prion protein 2 [Betta splendens]|uniref:Shadow of prion protein 2 n=1 Tax=Betta splendens TaxID=158456 RepID=A0A8M1HKS3_BETSP|nr:shadow of prion protein 2 [Betta splendens]
MAVHNKLLSLCVCLVLMAALGPGTRYASAKRGFGFRGRGKGDSNKAPPSQSQGLTKQGLKWAGAAAAGALGGTGYGLGLFGRPKHGPKNHHDHKAASTEKDQWRYYNDSQGNPHRSLWRGFVKAAGPAPPTTNIFLTFGHVAFLIATWIRVI